MKWEELRRMKFSEEEIRQIDREAVEELIDMDLRALRESAGKTQMELAELTKLAQSELSKIERRDDHMVSRIARELRPVGWHAAIQDELGYPNRESLGIVAKRGPPQLVPTLLDLAEPVVFEMGGRELPVVEPLDVRYPIQRREPVPLGLLPEGAGPEFGATSAVWLEPGHHRGGSPHIHGGGQ